MKKHNSFKNVMTGLVLAAGVFMAFPAVSEAKSFTDLGTNGSHNEAVKYLNSLEVFDYKTGNVLQGNSAVTRGEGSKILYNLYNDELEKVRTYNNNFKDINNTTYSKEIIWAYEVGIFDGDSNKKFNPKNSMTRAQMSKILVNSFDLTGKGTKTFKDVSSKHWAHNYISILASNDITTGDGRGNFMPNNNVTLNQLSSFIFRIMNMEKGDSTPEVKPPTSEVKPPTSNVKPPVEGTSKYKTFDDLKKIAKDLYDKPQYQPEEVVVLTNKDFKKEFTEYGFLSSDISSDIPGYSFYGRVVQLTNTEIEDGVFENRIAIYNDRYEDEQIDWDNRMDKAEKHIVDNYKLETDYDVIYAVTHFISEQIEYGKFIPDDHPFLVQRGNATTCTGYADVAAELYKRFGIETRILTGDMHAWNAVKVGGEWYYNDPTFADSSRQLDKYLLMTNAERGESINDIESTFKVSDVPFNQSMANPYSYKK